MKKLRLAPGVLGHAQFEPPMNGELVARVRLDRWWDASLALDESGRPADDRYRPLVMIGMNPSLADATWDDPTIAKGTKYARREGANGLVMINMHPGISTDPDELANVLLPYGCDERQWDAVDGALSEKAIAVVAAWGKPPRNVSSWSDRVAKVRAIAADVGVELKCFGANKDGSPKHPLYRLDSEPLVGYR